MSAALLVWTSGTCPVFSSAGAAVAHGAALARDESASLHLGDDFRAQLLSALAEMLQNIPADDNDALFRRVSSVVFSGGPSVLQAMCC